MRNVKYQDFSLGQYSKKAKGKKIVSCQFELTFKCDLRCQHCYCQCYNKNSFIKKELSTAQVKKIIDKLFDAGILWLCFTGGDPLTRPDFIDIYSYAKEKGFIITIFTNGYSLNKKILSVFLNKPPFKIELTINAVDKKIYEEITGVKGSFDQAIKGLNLLVDNNIWVKAKTMITKTNVKYIDKIRKYFDERKIKRQFSYILYPQLNGDSTPCQYRCDADIALKNGLRREKGEFSDSDNVFPCNVKNGAGLNVDPYGNAFFCACIREKKINLLENDVDESKKELLLWAENKFKGDYKCSRCKLRKICFLCPGIAALEKGSFKKHVQWFCDLAEGQINLER